MEYRKCGVWGGSDAMVWEFIKGGSRRRVWEMDCRLWIGIGSDGGVIEASV